MSSVSKRPTASGTVAKAIASFAGFIIVSVMCGVLASGFVLPAVGVATTMTQSSENLFNSLPAELTVQPLSEQSTIRAADGSLIATFYVENRKVVDLDSISPNMQNAVVAVEDRRFWDHKGVDVQGILRSLAENLKAGGVQAGGSSLTQQFVKNVRIEKAASLGDTEAVEAARAESYQRKLQEAKLAIALEQRWSKEQILAGYLNIAQFGPQQYGAETAAEYYFGIPAKDLNVVQAATLAGITKAPNFYDPTPVPGDDAATAEKQQHLTTRRDWVLQTMYTEGYIDKATYEQAKATPLTDYLNITPTPVGCATANNNPNMPGVAYFCDYVVATIKNNDVFGKTADERMDLLRTGGLTITTTLDPVKQQQAYQAVVNNVPINDPSGVNTALSVVQPRTGHVLAMAQNTNYATQPTQPGETAVNFNTDKAYGGSSGFQPGSSFKVYTLLEWLKEGNPLYATVSAAKESHLQKEYATSCREGNPFGREVWDPANSDGKASGSITVLKATTDSVNTAFASMARQMDLCAIRDTASSMGFNMAVTGAPIPDDQIRPAFIIGTVETAPLTMAASYAALAAEGEYCSPIAITAVTDRDGNPMQVPSANCHQAVSEDVARAATFALQTVVDHYKVGIGRDSAGKSGTTNDNVAAWFVGYTPQLASAVWTGFSTGNVPMTKIRINGKYYTRVYGGYVSGTTWQDFMASASEGLEAQAFTPPPDDMIYGKQIGVPSVVGMSVEDATATLAASGLRLAQSATPVYSNYPAGTIAAQSPGASSLIRPGSQVLVTLSQGPAPVVEQPVDPQITGGVVDGGANTTPTANDLFPPPGVDPSNYPPGTIFPNGYVVR